MKKILLSLTALVLLTSCADDDRTSENDNPHLKKMTQVSYVDGTIESSGIYEFVNGIPNKYNYLDESGNLEAYDIFSYNNGLLTTIKGFSANNVQLTQSVTSYDTQGRITGYTINDSDVTGTTGYVYNADNTITATSLFGTHTQTKTYYLNSDNLIYKEVSPNNFYEVEYNGYNPISSESNYESKTFEYLDTPAQPAQINIWGTILGSYKANAVLRDNSLQDYEQAYATKFIKKEVRGSEIIDYTYTFNDAQLPIKVLRYRNNIIESEINYFYE
jgi:hypothetical protein